MRIFLQLFLFVFLFFTACKKQSNSNIQNQINPPKGMIWVEGKTFIQGAKISDAYAMPREKPAHKVTVDGFLLILLKSRIHNLNLLLMLQTM